MKNEILKELCLDNNIAAVEAHKIGKFDRFETCSSLEEGGLTPTLELFTYLQKNFNDIPQVIMIRISNSFRINNDEEIIKMQKSIRDFANLGGKHFIFGYIDENREIDMESCNKLIDVIKEFPNTTWNFHMAIDEVENYEKAFETLINNGFTRVLTKGGKTPAINNIDKLKSLNDKYGSKIEILAGGKVNKDNYLEIHKKTGIKQFHGTKII